MVELPYGRTPYPLDLGGRDAIVVTAPPAPPPMPLDELLSASLDAPIGRPHLETLARPGARVTIIVSDATRKEPRAAFLAAVARRLPDVTWTIAIATGTHGPTDITALDLPPQLVRAARLVNHDGHRDDDLVQLGVTSRGTPVRVHRCVVDTDLVIATGCIRPHYFAGFGAGVKAIFPGLGAAAAIRVNHRLKTAAGSRAGIVDGNPCREDLEEATALVPAPTFLLDGVCAADDRVHAAVAGDPVLAFRAGAAIAARWFSARAPRASLVIASDGLPITASLYQAAKIAAASAPLVAPGGRLLVVAECAEGIEPLDVVNEAIFRIGVLPRLAPGVTLHLVSSQSRETIGRTLLAYESSPMNLVRGAKEPLVIVPRASALLLEALA